MERLEKSEIAAGAEHKILFMIYPYKKWHLLWGKTEAERTLGRG